MPATCKKQLHHQLKSAQAPECSHLQVIHMEQISSASASDPSASWVSVRQVAGIATIRHQTSAISRVAYEEVDHHAAYAYQESQHTQADSKFHG